MADLKIPLDVVHNILSVRDYHLPSDREVDGLNTAADAIVMLLERQGLTKKYQNNFVVAQPIAAPPEKPAMVRGFPLDPNCDGITITALQSRVAELEKVNANLRQAIIDRAGQMCAYCGTIYDIKDPNRMKLIQAHMLVCEKHPMRELAAENVKLKAILVHLRDKCEHHAPIGLCDFAGYGRADDGNR